LNLKTLVKPQFLHLWDQLADFLFERIDSEIEQSGLLKVMQMKKKKKKKPPTSANVCKFTFFRLKEPIVAA
jgi:hypothetical protein